MSRARLLIADDHAMVAEGLRAMLAAEHDVVDVVANGLDVVASVEQHHPDLVLLDISLPGRNGMELAKDLAGHPSGVKYLMLTMHADPLYADEAVRSGASGYVLKMAGSEELRFAIAEVLAGRVYVSPHLWEHRRQTGPKSLLADQRLEALTDRQREVLVLIAKGWGTRDIADELGIGVKSVEFHRNRIREVLGLTTTAALVRFAIEQGMV